MFHRGIPCVRNAFIINFVVVVIVVAAAAAAAIITIINQLPFRWS